MELRAFIETALLDIVEGIKDAQRQTDPGTIVPASSLSRNWVELGVTSVQAVEFDIWVRADETADKQAKIGVVSGLFGAGVAGGSSTENANETRIRLKVPIRMPTSDND